jgi:hypothetical protein
MAQSVKIWFDRKGDFLEVLFSDKPGYMRPTDHDAVMERVDDQGQTLGFTVMAVSKLDQGHPIIAHLVRAG